MSEFSAESVRASALAQMAAMEQSINRYLAALHAQAVQSWYRNLKEKGVREPFPVSEMKRRYIMEPAPSVHFDVQLTGESASPLKESDYQFDNPQSEGAPFPEGPVGGPIPGHPIGHYIRDDSWRDKFGIPWQGPDGSLWVVVSPSPFSRYFVKIA